MERQQEAHTLQQRVALRTAMKTQYNQKMLKNKTKPTVKDYTFHLTLGPAFFFFTFLMNNKAF